MAAALGDLFGLDQVVDPHAVRPAFAIEPEAAAHHALPLIEPQSP
jgi:hypothetical protein